MALSGEGKGTAGVDNEVSRLARKEYVPDTSAGKNKPEYIAAARQAKDILLHEMKLQEWDEKREHLCFNLCIDSVAICRTWWDENDIEQATQLARNMVTRWGMSDELGMVQLAPRENVLLQTTPGYAGPRPFSEDTARAIDAEVRRIIGESHDEARRLLTEHRPALEALAKALLTRETLDEREVLEVTGLPPAPALDLLSSVCMPLWCS